jgi:hypothetical protein
LLQTENDGFNFLCFLLAGLIVISFLTFALYEKIHFLFLPACCRAFIFFSAKRDPTVLDTDQPIGLQTGWNQSGGVVR